MTRQQFKDLNDAAVKGTIRDEENPAFLFSMVSNKLLQMVVSGELDAKAIAEHTLAGRGVTIKTNKS